MEKSGKRKKQSTNKRIKPLENDDKTSKKLLSRSMDDLSDEELTEILLRLPVDCIHRFRCVCKRWLTLTSETSFANFYIIRLHNNTTNSQKTLNAKHHDHVLLYQPIGYKVNPVKHISSTTDDGDDHWLSNPTRFFDFSLSFVPALRNPTRPHKHHEHCGCVRVVRVLRSQSEKLKFFNLMMVSEGLILCEAGFSHNTYVFYICNPLTKQWLELPPSPWPTGRDQHYTIGFMCNGTTFTIIRLDIDHKKFNMHVFISKTDGSARAGEWQIVCMLDWPRFNLLHVNEVVACNGRFHWIGEKSIVVYDPLSNPSRCDSIQLPNDITSNIPRYRGNRCIAVSEGCLRLYDHGKVSNFCQDIWIWDLLNYGRYEWCSKYKVIVKRGYRLAFFSETNRHTFYSISCYSSRIKIRHMPMDEEGCLDEWDLAKYRCSYTIRLLPYVINLWPGSLHKFNSRST